MAMPLPATTAEPTPQSAGRPQGRILSLDDHADHYARTPHAVAQDATLSGYAKAVYMVIHSFDWGEGCHASQADIARMAGWAVSTTKRAISELEASGLLHAKRRRGCRTVYFILVPPSRQAAISDSAEDENLAVRRLPPSRQAARNLAVRRLHKKKTKQEDSKKRSPAHAGGASAPQPAHGGTPPRDVAPPAPDTPPASAPYRVFLVYAEALGLTAAEAEPRKGKALRQAKTALETVAASAGTPEKAEADLCATLRWLGTTLKPEERDRFLTVQYAAEKVAEWRKVATPARPTPMKAYRFDEDPDQPERFRVSHLLGKANNFVVELDTVIDRLLEAGLDEFGYRRGSIMAEFARDHPITVAAHAARAAGLKGLPPEVITAHCRPLAPRAEARAAALAGHVG